MTCELQCAVSNGTSVNDKCAVLSLRSVFPIISSPCRFINFPDQPTVWREISVITAALRSDSQDKHAQFLRGERG